MLNEVPEAYTGNHVDRKSDRTLWDCLASKLPYIRYSRW